MTNTELELMMVGAGLKWALKSIPYLGIDVMMVFRWMRMLTEEIE